MAKYCNIKRPGIVFNWSSYKSNGNKALEITDMSEGYPERLCISSINVDQTLKEDEIAIKDYSENEGIMQDLIDLGIISTPDREIKSGFVSIPICRILKKYTNYKASQK